MALCLLSLLVLLVTHPLAVQAAPFAQPPILMYHRIDVARPPAAGMELTVSPQQFRDQLVYLKQQRLIAISMAQLARRLKYAEPLDRVVVVTFDDGYADQYRYAVPLLKRYGDSATFYIITAVLGDARHLSWPELRTMVANHMNIAAHGVRHDDLSQMTAAQQRYQIDHSVQILSGTLQRPIDSYAYPSGRFNGTTLRLVRAAGIGLGVTTDPFYVIRPQNRLEMTRLRVRGDWNLAAFAAALHSARLHRPAITPYRDSFGSSRTLTLRQSSDRLTRLCSYSIFNFLRPKKAPVPRVTAATRTRSV